MGCQGGRAEGGGGAGAEKQLTWEGFARRDRKQRLRRGREYLRGQEGESRADVPYHIRPLPQTPPTTDASHYPRGPARAGQTVEGREGGCRRR